MSDDPAEQSPASRIEEAKRQAIERLEWPTRKMAANLFRVTRGAGRPHDLPQQIIDLADMILEASKLSNAWGIWDRMESWLQSAVPGNADLEDWDDHRPAIVGGSLQVCASHLLGQLSQERMGMREIGEGIAQRDRRIEKARKKLAEEAAQRLPQPKKRIAKKRAPSPAKVKVSPVTTPAPPEESDEKLPGESTYDYMKRRSGRGKSAD